MNFRVKKIDPKLCILILCCLLAQKFKCIFDFPEANETHEYSLILEDTPGLPLGAKETDFEKGSADDDNLIEDGDAIVLDAEGMHSRIN